MGPISSHRAATMRGLRIAGEGRLKKPVGPPLLLIGRDGTDSPGPPVVTPMDSACRLAPHRGDKRHYRNCRPVEPKLPDLVISSAAVIITAATTATAGAGEIRAWGASFIDCQRPAFERLPIQACDCTLNILAFAELDKAETARRPCHLVSNHHGRGHLKARVGYKFAKSCIGGAVG